MKQSLLPENLEQDTIYRMSPGDIGYALYWAIYADEDGYLWIRGDYSVQYHPDTGALGQGVERFVRIERTREGVIAYRESLSADVRYERGPKIMDAWYPLPVELR